MTKEVQARMLLDSIKAADSGSVEYTVQTDSGENVRGTIEQAFFQEFKVANQPMTEERKQRITQENADYIEEMTRRQIRIGLKDVVIR